MTADLKGLAAGLSEAQRKALLAMGERREFPRAGTFTAGGALALTCHKADLARTASVNIQTPRSSKWRVGYYLMPLGLALRAHLLSESPDHG